MSYQTIASKYRSKNFKDLVGQEPVSLALMGSITQNRIPSGIIFSGTRGVGKTSLARIYAKALNCEGDTKPEPCGVCHSCEAITHGHHEDVVEIDGASNNGVDEVRALKESTAYIPQRSRYRIYIVDEVHMLSVSAFNALLKTLEEPPPHVVFLFATTEIDKIPQTVVSRCQTFRLQKISLANLTKRIEFILKEEGITWEEGLLASLAREGRGSLRDALTFLEQLIAISGSHLTRTSLEKILGSLSESSYIDLLEATLAKDSLKLLNIVEAFEEQGASFLKIANRLAVITRHAFVLKAIAREKLHKDEWDLEETALERLSQLKASSKELNELFKVFASSLEDLRESSLDRYIFENNLLSWCLLTEEKPQAAVLQAPATAIPVPEKTPKERPSLTAQMKTQLEEAKSSVVHAKESVQLEEKEKETRETETPAPVYKKEFPSSWKELVARWKEIKPLQARKLEEIIPHEYSAEKIVLLVNENSLVGPTFLKEETRKKVAIVLAKLFNFNGELVVKAQSSVSSEINSAPQAVAPQESLLDEKNRLRSEKEKNTANYLEQHEITRGLCEKFGGRVTETYVDV